LYYKAVRQFRAVYTQFIQFRSHNRYAVGFFYAGVGDVYQAGFAFRESGKNSRRGEYVRRGV
jgi:hypothetical protein